MRSSPPYPMAHAPLRDNGEVALCNLREVAKCWAKLRNPKRYTIPNFFPTFVKAVIARSRSAGECAAEIWTRMRA